MFRYWLCFVFFLAGNCVANHCRDANLCCPGRDSACVVQKAHQNAIIEDLTDKPCYCDHACLKLGDCCSDFRETCGVNPYLGIYRSVETAHSRPAPPASPQVPLICSVQVHFVPPLVGYVDPYTVVLVVDCEVSSWGPWSACDARCGAGSAARTRRVAKAPARGGRHCPALVQRRACRDHSGCPHDSMQRDETAMILPGALSVSRHFNATSDIRKNLRMRNPDDPEANAHREYCVEFQVTKVSKACHLDSDYKALREGEKVCVLCEAAALRRDLKWRCNGHGVAGHSTHFYALVAPHCRGKWQRVGSPDKRDRCCTSPHFIFV